MSSDKVDYLDEQSKLGSDNFVEKFIDDSYYYLMQFSLLYLKMGKKWRYFSILQFVVYYAVMAFHAWLLISSSIFLLGINFILFVHNTHIGLLTLLVATVVSDYQRHRNCFLYLHRMIATGFYDYHEPTAEAFSKHREDMLRERRRLAVVPVSACIASGAALVLANVFDRYGTFDFTKTDDIVTKDLPYGFGCYPYDTKNSAFLFYLSALMQVLEAIVLAAPIGVSGWSYIVLTQNIILQLKILMSSIERLEERAKYMCSSLFPNRSDDSAQNVFESNEFIYCYNKCLNKNFEHHQVILRAFNKLKELFSVPVFLSYMVGTMVIALSLLSSTGSGQELPGTTFASVLLCFAEVGFMYLFSLFSQYITDLSLDLRFTMYSTKWYYSNKKTARSIAIFQNMTLQPMTLTAGGIVPVNMDSFGKVMNSAYSYYNVVNAFNITI